MIILGLNAFHADSAAALFRDGVLIAAAEEERFRRTKHWAGFPSQAIAYCLAQARVTLADVDHIALNQSNRANVLGRLRYMMTHRPNPGLILARLKNRIARRSIADLLAAEFPADRFSGKIHAVEHHLAHMASAFHVSAFREAAVLSVDGFGDFASAAWGIGSDSRISTEGRILFPHSLGIFYQALTQYLGFPNYGDEYKVMGLAPYGTPAMHGAMRDIVRLNVNGTYALNLDYFRHHRDNIPYRWSNGAPVVGDLFAPGLEALLGPRRTADEPLTGRHRDIAHATQAIYEEAFLALASSVQEKTGLADLALSGGCAMNSVANGKVRQRACFRRLYVPPAAGDAGGAIGAALVTWSRLGGERKFRMDHAYWGPHYEPDDISIVLVAYRGAIAEAGCSVAEIADEPALCKATATMIAEGKVVGWFQGRMEWGPRALGDRSILCDPRRADMRERLNAKIKRREEFRPFAPSILREAMAEWFEEDTAVPFMTQVYQVKDAKRELIPAVVHVDGSGRPQTVSSAENPRFHKLIESFREATGVPMLLNTSFNENEPIVCTPNQALDCFLRTDMDALVLGNVILSRQAGR